MSKKIIAMIMLILICIPMLIEASAAIEVNATRNFSNTVAPDETFQVRIDAANMGAMGFSKEYLPIGFTFVNTSVDGGVVDIELNGKGFPIIGYTGSFTYNVTAPSATAQGFYAFNGTIQDENKNENITGGDKIIFISTRNGKRELFLMNEDGTSQNKIILNPEPNEPAYPIFSNYNKNKIIFLSKGNGKIYQAMLDTLESEEILSEITTYKKYDLLQHGTTGMIVYETVPDGWTITEVSLSPQVPFFYKENNYPTYKWIVYISGNLIELPSFTITYKIQIPQNANGLYEFSGSLSTGEEIEGNIDIEVSGFQKGDINNFVLFIPNKPEQQKTAKFLSSIDKSIEIVEEEIKQSQQWKKGLLQKMFT